MPIRTVNDQPRTETPRMRDIPAPVAAPDPTPHRNEKGHFMPGNGVGNGRGWKMAIRQALGDLAGNPEMDSVVRQAKALYLATLRSMPSDGPVVRQLIAAQCRHAALATFYANAAAKAGLASPEGLKLAEAARSHDGTAQRLSVTAYDRAVREAAKKPDENALPPWLAAEAEENGSNEGDANG